MVLSTVKFLNGNLNNKKTIKNYKLKNLKKKNLGVICDFVPTSLP